MEIFNIGTIILTTEQAFEGFSMRQQRLSASSRGYKLKARVYC